MFSTSDTLAGQHRKMLVNNIISPAARYWKWGLHYGNQGLPAILNWLDQRTSTVVLSGILALLRATKMWNLLKI